MDKISFWEKANLFPNRAYQEFLTDNAWIIGEMENRSEQIDGPFFLYISENNPPLKIYGIRGKYEESQERIEKVFDMLIFSLYLHKKEKNEEKPSLKDNFLNFLYRHPIFSFFIAGFLFFLFWGNNEGDKSQIPLPTPSTSIENSISSNSPIITPNICPDGCMLNGKCYKKPEHAYCVEGNKNNAWLCQYGYKDTGSDCFHVGYSIFNKNNNFLKGSGKLFIDNTEGGDAYIKILSGKTKVFDFFLEKGKDYTIENISNGSYQFYSCSGTLDGDKKVLNRNSCSKFDEDFIYTTKEFTDRIQYTSLSITLFTTINGNAKTSNVSPELFNSL